MNHVKLCLSLLLLGICSMSSYAEPNDVGLSGSTVEFVDKTQKPQKPQKPLDLPDLTILPFSLTLPPDGYLWDGNLTISLNTASVYTTVKIEKIGEGIVHSEHFSHNEEKVVDYDLSFYGSGEYIVTITFSNADTYEAVIGIE